ncbi:MAG: right-handed parallel beta-helix repeat-containing protein [Anaerolineae bacterium]|nr:right-handed parallel beta-helix repeat-containing protein [Anaerolineae bacterium]
MQPLATVLSSGMAGQANTWPIVRKRLFGTWFNILALAVVIALAGALAGPVTVSAEPAEPGDPNGPVQVIEGPVMITDTMPLEPEDPCSVSGFIGANVTWSPATCNPYIMTGSVIVMSSATLTIAPGTRVEVTSLKALTVQGTLVARGVDGNPIVFTSNAASPGKGDWGYIHFADSSTDATVDANGNYVSGSILQYATVEYAGGASINDNGAVRIEASSPYIDHNTIRLSRTDGIHAWSNGIPYLFNNQVLNNGIPGSTSAKGIYVDSTGATTIKANTVQGNTYTGIDALYGTPALHDNIVTSNGYRGISVSGAVSTISNNTVNNNSQGGISFSGSAFTIDNNHVNGNSGPGIYAFGTGNISANTVTNNTDCGIYRGGSTGDVVGNTVTGNSTPYYGAGIHFDSNGDIRDNSITNNTAGLYGGGIWATLNNSGGQISNNTIANNSADARRRHLCFRLRRHSQQCHHRQLRPRRRRDLLRLLFPLRLQRRCHRQRHH